MENKHTPGQMVRHSPEMFSDSFDGDTRLIRTPGRRWHIWTRQAGNNWKREHNKPLTLSVGLKAAQIFFDVRYQFAISKATNPLTAPQP